MTPFLDDLRGNHARTDARAEDPQLRGRTYAIPFESVWQTCLGVGRELPRWSVHRSDDKAGRIQSVVASGALFPAVYVNIDVGLDHNGQTRVDVEATSASERSNFGRSRRLVIRFVSELDNRLSLKPGDVLDPAALPEFGEPT